MTLAVDPPARVEDAVLPWRIAVIQRTLPHYRLPTMEALLAATAPGSTLIHGKVQSARQPKQNAWLKPVSFTRLALPCWSMALRIGEQLIYPVYMPGLTSALRRLRPDVIICEGESNLLNNFAVVRYAREARIPYIWWGLGAIPGGRPSGLRRIFGRTLQRMIRQASGIACYSSGARDFYVGEGADPRFCQVVPNVLDHRAVVEGIQRFVGGASAQRHALGVAPDDLVLLTVGSLEPPKRIELALRALPLVRAKLHRRIHFWVVGDGPERRRLEELTRELALPDVHFWGARYDDVSLYFLMSDLFVLPGLGGLALNQAMMHGLPVVSGPADGTERDLLAAPEVGRLLNSVTPASLANAIEEMARLDLRKMGGMARRRVENEFSLAHQVMAMTDLITKVMSRPALSGSN